MKLVYDELNSAFTEENFNVIAAEDTATFRRLCENAKMAAEGEDCCFVASDGDKILSLSKIGLFLSDPLDLDFGDKKLTNKLLAELTNSADEKYGADIDGIVSAFSRLFDKLNGESSVEIDWFDESPITALFKAFGVGLKRDYDGFVDRLYNYLTAAVELCGVRVVFFVNIKSWLTEEERKEIYKLLKYHGTLAVSIESFVLPKIDGEFVVVIDGDLCEIVA